VGLRQKWLEKELQQLKEKEEAEYANKPVAKPIPATTKKPLYKLLLTKQAQRRERNKEESVARNKALSKPFSFIERDEQVQRLKALECQVDDSALVKFRAKGVPWRILIPRFRMMAEKEEFERE